MNEELKIYLTDRVDNQLIYLNSVSYYNQKLYKLLKMVAIVCNVLTTMTISITFTVPQEYKVYLGILALVLSTIVLSTYQIEEVQNYGAKWEKFRLAAEQLKSEKYMFLNNVGTYDTNDPIATKKHFVENVELIIRRTDISYFALMIDPGKRTQQKAES